MHLSLVPMAYQYGTRLGDAGQPNKLLFDTLGLPAT
jgi:hypothetical protein